MSIEVLLKEFQDVAYSPNKQLSNFKAQGKKVIGVLPYYAPEELVCGAATTSPSSALRSTALPSTAPSLSWLWRCCWTVPWTSWTV